MKEDFEGGLLTFIDKVVIQEKLSQCMLIVQFGSKGFWIDQLKPVLDYAENGNFR